MGTKRKDRITVGVTALILFGFLTGNIAKSDDTVSISERRKLAQFPKINVENMKDGTFMSGFESYAKDQFPLREQFRALKTAFSMYVLGQKDQHGLYIKDGYIAKMEYPLHADSLQYAVTRFGEVYDRYLSDTDTDIYLAIVPDKSYFLADENGYPSMDYDMLTAQMRDGTKYAQYIDIFGDLEAFGLLPHRCTLAAGTDHGCGTAPRWGNGGKSGVRIRNKRTGKSILRCLLWTARTSWTA